MRINAELKAIVAEMFELMYEAKGVGLAANQVNLPLRLFVANPSGAEGEGGDGGGGDGAGGAHVSSTLVQSLPPQ